MLWSESVTVPYVGACAMGTDIMPCPPEPDCTTILYGAGSRPTAVTLNGKELSFTREANPYRTVGAGVPMAKVLERLTAGTNELLVCLG
jgi:hypothetical protein